VKVARWERPDSGELDGKLYNNSLKQLPHKIDRIKQNAIYVDISANGRLESRCRVRPSSVKELFGSWPKEQGSVVQIRIVSHQT